MQRKGGFPQQLSLSTRSEVSLHYQTESTGVSLWGNNLLGAERYVNTIESDTLALAIKTTGSLFLTYINNAHLFIPLNRGNPLFVCLSFFALFSFSFPLATSISKADIIF